MIGHEKLLELDAIYLFETAPQIERYVEQPEKIRYPDGALLRRYTPLQGVGSLRSKSSPESIWSDRRRGIGFSALPNTWRASDGTSSFSQTM